MATRYQDKKRLQYVPNETILFVPLQIWCTRPHTVNCQHIQGSLGMHGAQNTAPQTEGMKYNWL